MTTEGDHIMSTTDADPFDTAADMIAELVPVTPGLIADILADALSVTGKRNTTPDVEIARRFGIPEVDKIRAWIGTGAAIVRGLHDANTPDWRGAIIDPERSVLVKADGCGGVTLWAREGGAQVSVPLTAPEAASVIGAMATTLAE